MNAVCDVFQIIGLILEIVGIFLMANSYFPVKNVLERLKILISALFRLKFADKVFRSNMIYYKEDKLIAVQGLMIVGIGFLMQLLSALLRIGV